MDAARAGCRRASLTSRQRRSSAERVPCVCFLNELGPETGNLLLERVQRARILDDEIGSCSLELGRHLRRDHVHGFGFAQPAVPYKPFQAQRTWRVDENDPVKARGHVLLEEKRDVADHNPVAALPGVLEEALAQALDLGVDDLVELLELTDRSE